jgi:hypothetical protein
MDQSDEKFSQSEAHLRYLMSSLTKNPVYYHLNYKTVLGDFYKHNAGKANQLKPEVQPQCTAVIEEERSLKRSSPDTRVFYHARNNTRAYFGDVFSEMLTLLYGREMTAIQWYKAGYLTKEQYLVVNRWQWDFDGDYTLATNISFFGNYENEPEETSSYWLRNHSHTNPYHAVNEMLLALNLPPNIYSEYKKLHEEMVNNGIAPPKGRLLVLQMDSQTADQVAWVGLNMPISLSDGQRGKTFCPSFALRKLCRDPQEFAKFLASKPCFDLFCEEKRKVGQHVDAKLLTRFKPCWNPDTIQVRVFYDPVIFSSGRIKISSHERVPVKPENRITYLGKIRDLCHRHLELARPFLNGLRLPVSPEEPQYVAKQRQAGFKFFDPEEAKSLIEADSDQLRAFVQDQSIPDLYSQKFIRHADERRALWEHALISKKWLSLRTIFSNMFRDQPQSQLSVDWNLHKYLIGVPEDLLFELVSHTDPFYRAEIYCETLLTRDFYDATNKSYTLKHVRTFLTWMQRDQSIPKSKYQYALRKLVLANNIGSIDRNDVNRVQATVAFYKAIAEIEPMAQDPLLDVCHEGGYIEEAGKILEADEKLVQGIWYHGFGSMLRNYPENRPVEDLGKYLALIVKQSRAIYEEDELKGKIASLIMSLEQEQNGRFVSLVPVLNK